MAGDALVPKTPVPIFVGFYDKPIKMLATASGGALVRMPRIRSNAYSRVGAFT